jgi:hypothetical protein
VVWWVLWMHAADPIGRGSLIEHHVDLPHVASVSEQGLRADVEWGIVVVGRGDQPLQLLREAANPHSIIVVDLRFLKQPVDLGVLQG